MSTILTTLSRLLDTSITKYTLSIVINKIDEDLWVVQNIINNKQRNITASGLTVGVYVVHKGQNLITNLGFVDLTVVNV